MLRTLCHAPGCICLVQPGEKYCEKHKPKENEKKPFIGWMSDQQKVYYHSQRWNNLRAQLLRKNPVCQMCGTNPSEECHHQYPIGYDFHNEEDFFNSDNIICLCRACHQKVTHQRMNEMRQWTRKSKREGKLWY